MKHKLIQLISLILIATFIWQVIIPPTPWDGPSGDRSKIRNGDRSEFSFENVPNILRPRAAGERRSARGGRIEGDWEILPDGARRHITAEVDDSCVIEGPDTVIHAGAVIKKNSIIRNAIIKQDAYVEASIIETVGHTDKWEYKERSNLFVESQRPTVIGAGTKVVKSVVYSSRIGDNTELRETAVEHSDVGDRNYFEKAKLSLAKTKHNVFATWAELSEGIFGFGFHYDGLALGGPAYFEGIYSNRFPVAEIPGLDLSRMTKKKVDELIGSPQKLQAFLKEIKYKSIRGVPHVSMDMPYNIYSVFTGRNLPPPDGILEGIEGRPGEQKSQHARNAVGPTVVVAPETDVAPKIRGGWPDPRWPRGLLTKEYTYQAGFSLSGFRGQMVHGQLRPGAESHGLSPSQIKHLWTFTHCPALIFKMMENITADLPKGEKGKFDELPTRAIETGFLMTLYDLNEARGELDRLKKKRTRDEGDQRRMASLERLEENLSESLTIYVRNLQANRRYGLWRFENGQKDPKWRHAGGGIWRNKRVKLTWLSNEKAGKYKQYRLNDILGTKDLEPRVEPRTVLSERDLKLISGEVRIKGSPKRRISKTAHVKNVRFYGTGEVVIKGNVNLENIVIIANGKVVIDENTSMALGRIEATEGQVVHIGKDCALNYSNIKDSTVGAGTKGYYIILERDAIGEKNTLNPFADITDTETDAECIIGHVMRHSEIARGFISRHIPTEIYYLKTPPVVIKIGKKKYEMANPMNIGAGAHIMGKEGHPVIIEGGAFIGSNAWLYPDAVIRASFVLGVVPAGKRLLPFTFYNSATGTEELGGLLDEKWAGVIFRTFIYRGKLYTAEENKWAGDYFVPQLMTELEAELTNELGLRQAGEETEHSQGQIETGFMHLKRARQDGRWIMENHKFVYGRWKYTKKTDAWHWRRDVFKTKPGPVPEPNSDLSLLSSILRPLATGEGESRAASPDDIDPAGSAAAAKLAEEPNHKDIVEEDNRLNIAKELIDHAASLPRIDTLGQYGNVIERDIQILKRGDFQTLTQAQREDLLLIRAQKLGMTPRDILDVYARDKVRVAYISSWSPRILGFGFHIKNHRDFRDRIRVYLLCDMFLVAVGAESCFEEGSAPYQPVYLGRAPIHVGFYKNLLKKIIKRARLQNEARAEKGNPNTQQGYQILENSIVADLSKEMAEERSEANRIARAFLAQLITVGLIDSHGYELKRPIVLIDGPEYSSMALLAKAVLVYGNQNNQDKTAIYLIGGILSSYNTYVYGASINAEYMFRNRPADSKRSYDFSRTDLPSEEDTRMLSVPEFVMTDRKTQWLYYLALHEMAKKTMEIKETNKKTTPLAIDAITEGAPIGDEVQQELMSSI